MTPLRPFFSYYGAKHRIGRLYPAPRYPHIIEPFCGSAAYATRYHDRAVTLLDVDERIVGIWRFLTAATQRDILSQPLRLLGCVHFVDVREAGRQFSDSGSCAEPLARAASLRSGW